MYGEVVGFKSMYLRLSCIHNNLSLQPTVSEAEMETLRNFLREMVPQVVVLGGDRYFCTSKASKLSTKHTAS